MAKENLLLLMSIIYIVGLGTIMLTLMVYVLDEGGRSNDREKFFCFIIKCSLIIGMILLFGGSITMILIYFLL